MLRPVRQILLFATASAALISCPHPTPMVDEATLEAPIVYPSARRDDSIVDEYHGVQVPDPYRWLEDPDSDETRAWIEANNALTEGYLSDVGVRDDIAARLKHLWNYERFGLPHKYGDRYFFEHNDGLQNQAVLYWMDSLDGERKVLIDPNTLSDDGTVSLNGYTISKDGKRIAYGLSDGGSDWTTYRVRDVATGEDLEDEVRWVKFNTPSWTPDGVGFFYARYPEPTDLLEQVNLNHTVYYHRLGTDQSDDKVVLEAPEHPQRGFGTFVTDDGAYMVAVVWEGTDERNRVYMIPLTEGAYAEGTEVRHVLDDYDAMYQPLGSSGSTFFFQTDLGAPRGRVIAIDVEAPERENWRDVVPETDAAMQTGSLVGEHLLLSYLVDATTKVAVHTQDGDHVRDVDLPGLGTASGFGGRIDEPETFYAFGSYTTPGQIYRYDVATGQSTLFREPTVDFDPEVYETKQVFITSRDGTKVPVFLTHKKGLELDGNNPTLLYGYGGFNVSLTPGFRVSALVWLEMGGVYAVANLRGGGEYGREWHEAGTKLNKQNVFDDFIAAASWLIDNGYTRPDKLAINGGSNGGLLVGACTIQRPDLFGAALPQVGVLDMLRYHQFTIGWAWESDYGRADDPDDPEMFSYLYGYSPYHNTEAGTHYPPTLITTGDHDDRVVPAHSFKFAAAMQHAQGGPDPVLIRIETRAGHGAGKPMDMVIDEISDQYAFLMKALDIQPEIPGVSPGTDPATP